ncbi:MAG: type II toxin-antitoxin system HicB family antitoxin [Brasilonema sp.]
MTTNFCNWVREQILIMGQLFSIRQQIMKTFTAYIEWDSETKLYVGIVPGIPGAHTQGATLDELKANLQEVLELCLEEYKDSLEDLPQFVGLQQIEVAV